MQPTNAGEAASDWLTRASGSWMTSQSQWTLGEQSGQLVPAAAAQLPLGRPLETRVALLTPSSPDVRFIFAVGG